MSDRLFPIEDVPEVPLLRAPSKAFTRGRFDERFRNDYPPEWDRCTACQGEGMTWGETQPLATLDADEQVQIVWRATDDDTEMTTQGRGSSALALGEVVTSYAGRAVGMRRRDKTCVACLGMGSVKAMVRRLEGHRCERCKHPYVPKGDAEMLGVEPSGLHECMLCLGSGSIIRDDSNGMVVTTLEGPSECPDCKGTGKVWTPWSACDEQCRHDGPLRVNGGMVFEYDFKPEQAGHEWVGLVEAVWRILTVHHLDGDKANVCWWNLAALCQRCHLEIQAKVVMDRVYPFEHSEWFKPHAAGWYAWAYNGEELTRDEVNERMDELLALELQTT